MGYRTAREFFIDVVGDRCQALSNCLDPLLLQVYPTNTPRRLCEALKSASIELSARAEEFAERFPLASSEERREIDLEISLISSFIDVAMGDWCPMLAASSVGNIPAEAINPIGRMVKQLFPKAEVIVQGTPDLNYYYREIGDDIKATFEHVGLHTLLDDLSMPDKLFLIGICLNPPNGILTHCVIAHEVGHALYETAKTDERLIPKLMFDEKAVSAWVEQEFTTFLPTREPDGATQGALDQSREFLMIVARAQLQAVAARWICELFCDVVGVAMFGPAYICSLSLFSLPGGDPANCSDSHPPDALRAKTSLRALFNKKWGFAYLRNNEGLVHDMTEPWAQYTQESSQLPTSPNYSIAFKAVSKLGTDIIREARSVVGPTNIFDQKQFALWVRKLVDRIDLGLPPNEVRKNETEFEVAGFPAIMNAGWYVYLYHLALLHEKMPALEGV